MEALAALFAIAMQRVKDDGIRLGGGLYLIDLDGLAFEQFVVLKKTAQHDHAVRGHLGGFVIRVELRIFGGDCDDLMIGLAGVDHRHEADGAGVNDGERDDSFLAEDEDVERVVVFGEGLRDEAVIGGVVHSGVENAIEADESAGFIEFIFHAGAEGNLDHAIEFFWKLVAGSDVVPGMDHRAF